MFDFSSASQELKGPARAGRKGLPVAHLPEPRGRLCRLPTEPCGRGFQSAGMEYAAISPIWSAMSLPSLPGATPPARSLSRKRAVISPTTCPSAAMMVRPRMLSSDGRTSRLPFDRSCSMYPLLITIPFGHLSDERLASPTNASSSRLTSSAWVHVTQCGPSFTTRSWDPLMSLAVRSPEASMGRIRSASP